jgi:hypothetical protein
VGMMTLKSVKWLSPQVDRRVVHQDRVTAFRFSPFRYNIRRRTIGVMCLLPDILIVFLNSAHMCGTRGRLKVPDPALGSSSERPSG